MKAIITDKPTNGNYLDVTFVETAPDGKEIELMSIPVHKGDFSVRPRYDDYFEYGGGYQLNIAFGVDDIEMF